MTLPATEAVDAWFGTAADALPEDAAEAVLIGRVWNPAAGVPSPVVVRAGELFDLSDRFQTRLRHL